jgi:hypothetical protein
MNAPRSVVPEDDREDQEAELEAAQPKEHRRIMSDAPDGSLILAARTEAQ